MQFYFVYAGKAGRAETKAIHAWYTWGEAATVRLLYLLRNGELCKSQAAFTSNSIPVQITYRREKDQNLLC